MRGVLPGETSVTPEGAEASSTMDDSSTFSLSIGSSMIGSEFAILAGVRL